ncbi:hypothetical protein ACXR6G_05825 [Ancylomarina sp. YFZ004]
MSKLIHRLSIAIYVLIVLAAIILIGYYGSSYYQLNIEERFYHTDHQILKSSGMIGHGLGIIGSLMILAGVFLYMARKRIALFSRIGVLKYWLEFHIFLCVLGPVLVLYHTAFKFGGLVAISFWSMVAVVLSGIIGRFIYIQIPRTIEGRELSLKEVRGAKTDLGELLRKEYDLEEESFQLIVSSLDDEAETSSRLLVIRLIKKMRQDRRAYKRIDTELRKNQLTRPERLKIKRLVINEIVLNRKIGRLAYMQKLFEYWHVAHLPFALVMLIILLVHVVVSIIFGYKWIF